MERLDRTPEEKEQWVTERRGGEELLGEPLVPPTLYRCKEHGNILAQDVVWRRDHTPHCPYCDSLLERLE